MTNDSLGDLGLFSLFRSPFLFPSLLFHALLFLLALRAVTFSVAKPDTTPISVQLMEVRDGGSDNKSIGPGRGPGGPRSQPKLGVPIPPAQQTGKLESGDAESVTPSNTAEAAPPKPVILPAPRVLAADTRQAAIDTKETSPDSLVRLPTREAATQLPGSTAADNEMNQKSLAALKGVGDGPGIKALKEGAQIPGALKGTGSGIGPYGVPGGSKSGTGFTGGGTGTGTGGGSKTGLKGISNADWDEYIARLKKRVESVWKYPEDVTGVQKVAFLFTLDRAGKLTQVEVLESSNARLNASAVEAMRRASPFAPLPESLKDLANEPLRIIFTVTVRVRG
ncbi:MAG: TonB C-terminal domain-containing protein [Deltaproteobacteria bacterium]|nr:TonB C-terminal domain-containing protein [Deltaproteobacteria bacterium]